MRHVFKNGILFIALAILAAAIVAGCASAPVNTQPSTSGIRAAEEVGAEKVPQASLHMQLAKEELATAKKMIEKGDKKEATSMLLRASADAELAVALSHGEEERLEAEKAFARVNQLRQENP